MDIMISKLTFCAITLLKETSLMVIALALVTFLPLHLLPDPQPSSVHPKLPKM